MSCKRIVIMASEASTNTVWVGSLPDNLDTESFRNLFAGTGNVIDVKLFPDKWYGFVHFASSAEAAAVAQMYDGVNVGGKGLKVKLHERKGKGEGKKSSGQSENFSAVSASVATTGDLRSAPYPQSPSFGGKGVLDKAITSLAPELLGACAHSQLQLLGGRKSYDFAKGADSSNVYVKGLPAHADDLFLYKLFAPFGSVHSVFSRDGTIPGSRIGFVSYASNEEAAFAIHRMNGQMTLDGYQIGCSLQQKKMK